MTTNARILIGVGAGIVFILIGSIAWYTLAGHWMGIRQNADESNGMVSIGTYDSLDACRTVMENIGGWCGKDCHDYKGVAIANCNPVVTILKK
jgi:hypothetical protein